jgi:hypothetical protein
VNRTLFESGARISEAVGLTAAGVRKVEFAANQHSRGLVQICDDFWPYVISIPAENTESADNYVKRIRARMETRRCARITFTPADE